MPTSGSLLQPSLSDPIDIRGGIEINLATQLFQFFKHHPLFRWKDANNDCEDRAHAICLLLDKWHIPNYKGWVFSGRVLKQGNGHLINFWNYHVAALIPVIANGTTQLIIIDPSTQENLSTIQEWADHITAEASCYYVITTGETYIFRPGKIERDQWFSRNKQNYKWMIQGLAGINGASKTGQAKLIFRRNRIIKAKWSFKNLLDNIPEFINNK